MNSNGIEFLFGIFPREIGITNPFQKNSFYRKEVTCKRDFQRYLTLMSGSNRGTYVSIYDSSERPLIDKVVFDLDSKDLNEAFADADILMDRLHKRNIPAAAMFSGKKGFHCYGLLKGAKIQRDAANYYLGNLQRNLSQDLKTMDSSIIGDSRRMIRIPNTLNGKIYCTPLPFEFRKMSITEILDYSKTQHSLNFFPGELKTIEELSGDSKFQKRDNTKEFKDEIKVASIPSMEILEDLIRPCVFAAIKEPNPCDTVRLNFVSEMMFLSFRPKQILDVIKRLNWDDFDERATSYHIKKVFEKRLKPFSNSKLSQVLNCKDNSYYWWSEK